SPLMTTHLECVNGMALLPFGIVNQSITTSSRLTRRKFADDRFDTSVHLDAVFHAIKAARHNRGLWLNAHATRMCFSIGIACWQGIAAPTALRAAAKLRRDWLQMPKWRKIPERLFV
ncbi:hypothetical protein DIPPA_13637, partial [Diplonema papillatum]